MQTEQPPLEAASPFELRVNLGKEVPEADVRSALASGDMGFLHSFTTGSTVDGPGVRVVAWTAGCMWRCRYCHNPDTWTMSNGIPVTITKAIEELRKYRHGLKVMSGGLTISGGEPLMQHRFVAKLFAAASAMGIHTALDSNGYYGARLTDAELETISLVLLDIKTWDPERHRRPDRYGQRADARVRPPARSPSTAYLAALRAGARPD
jgi:pyruvate formate lyase activating enzyme